MKAVRYWIGVSKKEEDKCAHAVCIFMADNAMASAFDGKKSVYKAFKKFDHGVRIQIDGIKYLFSKALESKQMIENMLGEKRKGLYDISEMVQVNKKVRTHNESE